jgi:hypothetical protein
MGESYTHLLIPVVKTCRPAGNVVAKFLEHLIQNGRVGDDYRIGFNIIERVESHSRSITNPFTRKTVQVRTPSRRRKAGQDISAVSDVIELADTANEYDVTIESSLKPRNQLLEIGSWNDGGWQPWPDGYSLEVVLHVRASLVRICLEAEGDADVSSRERPVRVDEDCSIGDLTALFRHPESQEYIRIPSAGCARTWIEIRYGKWLCPKLEMSSIGLLDRSAPGLVRDLFQGNFVEGFEWG